MVPASPTPPCKASNGSLRRAASPAALRVCICVVIVDIDALPARRLDAVTHPAGSQDGEHVSSVAQPPAPERRTEVSALCPPRDRRQTVCGDEPSVQRVLALVDEFGEPRDLQVGSELEA